MSLIGRLSSEESLRKSVHLAGFAVPYVVMKAGVGFAAAMIGFVAVLYLTSEALRVRGRSLPVVTKFTRKAARPEELGSYILRPAYFALGILVTLLIFPARVSFAAIAILTVGDGVSSIVGGLLGHMPLPFNSRKTLEGTLAGFLSGFASAMIFVSPFSALVGAIAGSLVEALPLRVDDNLTVPLSSGLAMSLLL